MDWLLPLAMAGCYFFYLWDLPWRRESRGWKLAAFCLLAACLWAVSHFRDFIPWYLKQVLSYGAVFLVIWGSRRLRAADSLYHVVILFLSTDCILEGASHLSMVVWGNDYVYDVSDPVSHLLYALSITAAMLAILYVVRQAVFRVGSRSPVSLRQVCLMALTLLPILYLANIHRWLGIEPFAVGLHASVIRIVLSLCGLITILGYEGLYRSRLQAQDLKAMEAILQNQSQQYLMKKENAEAILQSCHDLKNQLYALRMSPGGGTEAYLEQLQKTIQRYDSLYQTGNEALDVILSEKGLRCREKDIDLVCVVQGDLLNFMEPTDVCTIFGNALDNAIEALKEITDRERRIIQVKAAQENGFLVIRFENPYDHPLNRTEAGLDTTKTDRWGHGYGLKGIRYMTEKYDGHMVIDTEEGKFVLTLLLPRQQSEKE